MRALITGGAGFIGSHLVEEAIASGHDVTILDRAGRDPLRYLAHVRDRVRVHAASASSRTCRTLLEAGNFDVVFHLAGSGEVSAAVANPRQDFEDSLESGVDLLEWARESRSPAKLIFASTASVYGEPLRLPIAEDDLTVPISPYGVSKLALERYAAVYSRLYGVRAASLRFFSLYGPRQQKLVVFDVLRKLTSGEAVPRFHGDGLQIRDFCYIKDAVRAATLVAGHGALEGETYNVGSGVGTSIREIIERLVELVAPGRSFEFTGSVRSGDGQAWVADIRRVSALGYAPAWALTDGLAATADWFRTLPPARN